MILSDRDIGRRIEMAKVRATAMQALVIKPYESKQVQPSSYDVTLSDNFWVFDNSLEEIDMRNVPDNLGTVLSDVTSVLIHPGRFMLGSTVEKIKLPHDLAARLEGKSSLGRLGLIIHATAGYVDPGFQGHLTLEITNISPVPIRVYSGMRIAQVTFHQMTGPVHIPYGHPSLQSRYQDQGRIPVPFVPRTDENE